MRTFCLVTGLVSTAWVFLAIVTVMLVPRETRSWMVTGVNGLVRGVASAPIALARSYARRDRWLAIAAPATVLLELVVYLVLLIGTLALVVYGTTTLTLKQSFYQSGATLTTLGIVEPVNVPSALATFVAAFFGLVVVAIFIGYLLALYAAFSAREGAMARLALIAGEPAWGPQILARGHTLGMAPEQSPETEEWVRWICETLMNTQVNPVLAEFRSTSAYRHWTVSMLSVLDATALRMSLTGRPEASQVRLLGAGAVAAAILNGRDGARNWDVENAVLTLMSGAPGSPAENTGAHLSDADVDDAWATLRRVGYPLPADLAPVTNRFLALRSLYAADVIALARRLWAVPAPWSGTRHPAVPTQWPEMAQK